MILRSLFILILTILIVACSNRYTHAQQLYHQGEVAYQQQNYAAAFSALLRSAHLGNSNSQYVVGYMYYNGLGIARDQTAALAWFQKAVKQGNPRAIQAMQQLEENAQQKIQSTI